MSTLLKSLSNKSDYTNTQPLGRKTLKLDEFEFRCKKSLISIDDNICQVRNYINRKTDKDNIFKIKQLLDLEGKTITLNDLPIFAPQDENNYFLMNNPGNISQMIRFQSLKKTVGFTEELTEIAKFEFDDDFFRVLVHINKKSRPKVFKVVFFDPFHHVALGYKGRKNLYWNYERCKSINGKHDCMSLIV